jgi:YfiH family protein
MTDMLITLPAFATARDGVRHFFGTRRQPERIETDDGLTMVSVKQVHGTDTLVIDRPLRAGDTFDGGWDALITDQPGVLLTVRTADCVPILLHDRKRGVVAAVHAGWRGAVAGIVFKTLDAMKRRFGSEPASVHMGIGPAVGPCCYEVDEPVLARLRAGFRGWHSVVRERGSGKAMLNLRELVRQQAQSVGVEAERIHSVNVCTVCHPDLFYSYRREGTVNGTMVSGIVLLRRRGGRNHAT